MFQTKWEISVSVLSLWSKSLSYITIALMVAALDCGMSMAADDGAGWPEDLQLHGFLSQGFVKTSDNRFYGPSDDGSWDFREIGANLSYQPRPDLLLAGQLLSRTAGDMYVGRVRVDYALVDYAPVMNQDKRAGLRVGRLKNPLGLYNDTRDVPFTRPSIFLPQSIYFDRVRNLELSSDGAGIYSDMQTQWGDFFLEASLGNLNVDKNVEYTFLNQDWPGKLDTDDPWFTGRLMYELDGGRLRLAASGAAGELNYRPGINDVLGPGAVEMELWILSAQYNEENWNVTAEYMNNPVRWNHFFSLTPNFPLPPALDRETTAEGWYVQATYRPAVHWELLLRYDVSYLDNNDRDGQKSEVKFGIPAHNFFAKDLTFGIRWDITKQFMMRAEYHRVEGTSWLSSRENDLTDTEKNWGMFSFLASYRF